jgi:hypothetical protein
MMRLNACLFFFIVSFVCAQSSPQGQGGPEGFAMLAKIRSPQDLLLSYFPKQYCATVELSGSVADEMKKAVTEMGLDPPRYFEYFNGSKFTLSLSNETYPVQTRDLLSGIINPPEMIDCIVASLTRYRTKNQFTALMKETNVSVSTDTLEKKPIVTITLTPKGQRFAYTYLDDGAFVQESWLTLMKVSMDTVSGLVYHIDIKKNSRFFEVSSVDTPQIQSDQYGYRFFYEHSGQRMLPKRLFISINGKKTMDVEAYFSTYGRNKVVFDKKTICLTSDSSSAPGNETCLCMTYKNYQNSICRFSVDEKKPGFYGKQLSKAADLSKKAADELRTGNISSSIRILKTLVEKYPGTPQAIEAKRLLSSVSSGLQ